MQKNRRARKKFPKKKCRGRRSLYLGSHFETSLVQFDVLFFLWTRTYCTYFVCS